MPKPLGKLNEDLVERIKRRQQESGVDSPERWTRSEVGPGWIPLVESCLSDLLDLGWDGELWVIKEKFGTLRLGIGLGGEFINNEWVPKADREPLYERISKAESESAHTCEQCGSKDATQTNSGWIRTLCTRCHKP